MNAISSLRRSRFSYVEVNFCSVNGAIDSYIQESLYLLKIAIGFGVCYYLFVLIFHLASFLLFLDLVLFFLVLFVVFKFFLV